MKKRILLVNEASYLSTGFSVYGYEVLSRLFQSDKYELAEFGIYGQDDDARWRGLPWKFYPNQPATGTPEIDQYLARPTFQFGEWRFESVCLDFKPDIVCDIRDWWMCLSPYTTIVCEDGLKTAEEITVGDIVLTHTGRYQKVIRTFARTYNGNMVKLQSTHCALPIFLTTGHPVLAIKRDGNKNFSKLSLNNLQWIDSDKIAKGDLVCFPIAKHNTICVNETLEDKCKLLGYYAAEGCMMYNGRKHHHLLKGIQFTFGIDEEEFVYDVKELVKKIYNVDVTITAKKDNSIVVRAFSRTLAEDVNKLIPGIAGTKQINKEIFELPNNEIRKFLCGLFRGDGSYNSKTGRSSYCTKSKTLAFQVFQLCLRLGMLPSFNINKNRLKNKTYYRYIFNFAGTNKIGYKNIIEDNQEDIPVSSRIVNDYAFFTIKKAEHYQTDCIVYNFEVEKDNSYVSSFCLHNCEFAERSPFRPYFKLALMPTVDSAPQDRQWLATYMNADAVFAYSPFGYKTLSEEGAGLIKLQGIASPGTNVNDFKFVVDKKEVKESFNVSGDSYIIGTVMRNQERKLYPDLMEAFATLLKQLPEEIASKTYLYLHTLYPDVGWHIPIFLKKFGIAHKTLFTYICHNCHTTFASLYQDARTFCRRCGQYSCLLPGVQSGVSRQDLGKVLSMFDIYVQYAICEGFGMPLIEAGACGTIPFAVDYSAMSDIIKTIKGVPIKVQRMFCDNRTHAFRALPDNNDLIKKLIDVIQLPQEKRVELATETRKCIEEHYSWDNTAKQWENYFDNVEVLPPDQSWRAKSRVSQPNLQCPEGLTAEQFVQWGIVNIAGRPELLNTYVAFRLTRDLVWGASQNVNSNMYFNEASFTGIQPRWAQYDRNDVVKELLNACEQKNLWEQRRIGQQK